MNDAATPRMSGERYRADFYLYRHFLMGLGSFRDDGVTAHEDMKLVFGVNQSFRIRLDGQWTEARTILLDSGTPHYLNGEEDWQIVLWIDPESSLGILLKARTLEGRPWRIHVGPDQPGPEEVIQTLGDEPDPRGALFVAETLLRTYGAVRPVPATWDLSIRTLIRRIEEDAGSATLGSLADDTGHSVEDLSADFRRVVGAPLEKYLHRRKLSLYLELVQNGMDRSAALRRCGLPGWAGLVEDFRSEYGLDLDTLERQSAYVRVYHGIEDQAVLYL